MLCIGLRNIICRENFKNNNIGIRVLQNSKKVNILNLLRDYSRNANSYVMFVRMGHRPILNELPQPMARDSCICRLTSNENTLTLSWWVRLDDSRDVENCAG